MKPKPNRHITKILIANRGEIACRIIRTCRKLGIKSVAVYSDPDSNAPFVHLADEAIGIGGTTSAESYLVVDKILKAALESGADAIHPGYGFLSENDKFAEAISAKGLIFIGPTPQTIRDMGSKSNSKAIMEKAKVPVIPGYRGDDQSDKKLIAEALKIGFPCMIKASAGGGGKGLKRVYKESELADAISSAKREGKASFGDDTLLIEKYITNPRHIEIQVFGDQHGNVVYLFERECTMQRRHQKVVEEAPSAYLAEATRKKMGEAAIKAAKAVNYIGAGTVEFVADQNQNFYFLEMNTRLQVEHPVTEFITGLDLVELQIRVAQGEPLPFKQDEIEITGHAMEVRLYAEDPANSFLPVTGTIQHLDLPQLTNVRYDMGVVTGSEISVFYDPMLGKIIAYGRDRLSCIHTLSNALNRIAVLGTTTNLTFLNNLVTHPEHIACNMHTGFIDDHLSELTRTSDSDVIDSHIAAFCALLNSSIKSSRHPLLAEIAGFRVNAQQFIEDSLLVDGHKIALKYRITKHAPLTLEMMIADQSYNVQIKSIAEHVISLAIGKHSHDFFFHDAQDKIYLQSKSGHRCYHTSSSVQSDTAQAQEGNLTAPLPGKVLKIHVKAKQAVKAGETLIIVEAMKMEHPIRASVDGTVVAVHYKENDTVKLGDVLLEFAANDN